MYGFGAKVRKKRRNTQQKENKNKNKKRTIASSVHQTTNTRSSKILNLHAPKRGKKADTTPSKPSMHHAEVSNNIKTLKVVSITKLFIDHPPSFCRRKTQRNITALPKKFETNRVPESILKQKHPLPVAHPSCDSLNKHLTALRDWWNE